MRPQEGEIIYHPTYGFGIMHDLPTFRNMQVMGISNSCVPGNEVLESYIKKQAIDFQKWCLVNYSERSNDFISEAQQNKDKIVMGREEGEYTSERVIEILKSVYFPEGLSSWQVFKVWYWMVFNRKKIIEFISYIEKGMYVVFAYRKASKSK